jgi:hypothetical protein
MVVRIYCAGLDATFGASSTGLAYGLDLYLAGYELGELEQATDEALGRLEP